MHIVLVLRGISPQTSPRTIGSSHEVQTWKWSEKHNAYIWMGRELRASDFKDANELNALIDKVIDANSNENWNFPITIRWVEDAQVPLNRATNIVKARAALAAKRSEKNLVVHV